MVSSSIVVLEGGKLLAGLSDTLAANGIQTLARSAFVRLYHVATH